MCRNSCECFSLEKWDLSKLPTISLFLCALIRELLENHIWAELMLLAAKYVYFGHFVFFFFFLVFLHIRFIYFNSCLICSNSIIFPIIIKYMVLTPLDVLIFVTLLYHLKKIPVLFVCSWQGCSLLSFSPVSGTFPVLLQLPNGQTMPVAIPASITSSSVHIPTTIPVSVMLVTMCLLSFTLC